RGVVVYATYLGGSGTEVAGGIAADRDGNAYVAGDTTSRNFPAAGLQPRLATAVLYKTVDGTNWERFSDYSVGARLSMLTIDPANSSNFYARANGRLYKSTDAGGS